MLPDTAIMTFLILVYQYAVRGIKILKPFPAWVLIARSNNKWLKGAMVMAGLGDLFLEYDLLLPGIVSFSFFQIAILKYLGKVLHPEPRVYLALLTLGCLYPWLSYFVFPIIVYTSLLYHLYRCGNNHLGVLMFIGSDIMFFVELLLKMSGQTYFPRDVIPHFGRPLYWGSLLLLTSPI